MKRAERGLALLLVLLALPVLGREEAASEHPRAAALREVMTGAPLSERQRDNKVKKFAETLALSPKALAALLADHKAKAREAFRRERKKAMEEAMARLVSHPDAVEALVRQAGKARDAWEAAREGKPLEGPARTLWLRKQGLTRPGAAEAAAPYVFSDEDFVAVPPAVMAWLAAKGFGPEEAEVVVLELELGDQVVARMEAEKAARP